MNRISPAKTRKRCKTTISIEANVSATFFAIMRPVFGLYTTNALRRAPPPL
jgi:hypothetical protein